jgi:mannonate dehydratase
MPETDRIGIKLSMHPDDPHVDAIKGISRIMNNVENFAKLPAMHKTIVNVIKMCKGSFSLMGTGMTLPVKI